MCVVTHDQVKAQARLITEKLDNSLFQMAEYREAEVIGIDEAQFFGSNLPQVVDQIAHEGKTVIVAGLDGDFKRNQFGSLIDLIPMAEKVKKMSAVCFVCGDEASFTQRTKFNDSSHKIDQVQIVGGSEMYKPVCRACYRHYDEENEQRTAAGNIILQSSNNNLVSPIKSSNEDTVGTTSQLHTQEHESGKKRSVKDARGILSSQEMQR